MKSMNKTEAAIMNQAALVFFDVKEQNAHERDFRKRLKAARNRNAKIAELYYAGYSRRAISDTLKITPQRIAQILARHARENGYEWPPRSMTGGYGTRRDAPQRYKRIPASMLLDA